MEETEELFQIKYLDRQDREKIKYFLNLLLSKEKYIKLKKEISNRRKEISEGKTLSHEEIWKELDV